jgi:hypothetical protein
MFAATNRREDGLGVRTVSDGAAKTSAGNAVWQNFHGGKGKLDLMVKRMISAQANRLSLDQSGEQFPPCSESEDPSFKKDSFL